MSTAHRDLRPLVLLQVATLASGTGNGITLVALPWIALELTGRASSASVVATATALPLVVSSLLSGTVVDLLGRRATAIGSDVLSAGSVALIPVLTAVAGLDVATLAVLAAVGAAFDPAGVTARTALLPEAAQEAHVDLGRANAVTEAVWGAAFLIGPGIGGVLIAVLGATSTLWATAVGFVVALLATAAIDVPGAGRPPVTDRPTGLLRGTFDGLRVVWRDRLLRDVSLFSMALVAAYLPIEGVLLPAWYQQQGHPERLGVVIMALSAGGVCGALAYGRWGPRVRRRTTFVVATVGACAGLLVMGWLPPFGVMLAAALVVGILYGPVAPLIGATAQARAAPWVRGRVLGVLTAAEYAAGPVGYLLAGPAVDAFGIDVTFRVVTVVLFCIALLAVPLRSLHALDAP